MRRLARLTAVIAIAAAYLLMSALPVRAADSDKFVQDQTGTTLSADQLADLRELAGAYSAAGDTDYAILIVDQVSGGDYSAYADQYHSDNFRESSVVFILGMGDRQYYCAAYGSASAALPSTQIDSICAQVTDKFSSGDYYGGLANWLSLCRESVTDTAAAAGSGGSDSSDGSYVIDNAGLLSDDEEAALEARIASLREKYQYDIVIVTNESTGGKTAEAYADDFFDYNGYGVGSGRDGMLLLITFNDNEGYRTYWTSTRGFGITAFTDYGISVLGDKIESDLSDGDYNAAFNAYLDTADQFLAAAKRGEPYDVNHKYYTRSDALLWILIGVLAGATAATVTVLVLRSQLRNDRRASRANNYAVPGSFALTGQTDMFMYSSLVTRHHPRNNNGGGGGGGSSVHFSSSGASHGGGGGHF